MTTGRNKYTVSESGLYNVNLTYSVRTTGTPGNRDFKVRIVVDPASGGANYNLIEGGI